MKAKKWPIPGLKPSHVATCGATSRRDREQICPRRDVKSHVATWQRALPIDVAT